MKKLPFLWYPVVLFCILFLVDKVFFLPPVRAYLKPDFTYVYYEAKEKLSDMLIDKYGKGQRPENKKLMVILGSSRLLYFSHEDLKRFYPDWDVYNFSSAVTTPAYYYYYLDKLMSAGVQPDLVLLETDPNQFNSQSGLFQKSNLTYSFSLPFILKNAYLFGKQYVSFYVTKTLFGVSKNKPYINDAIKRSMDSNFDKIILMRQIVQNTLIQDLGNSISPVADYTERDAWVLAVSSQRTMDWLYPAYERSDMQFEFYKKLLSSLQENKIPTVIIWPQVSEPLKKLLSKEQFIQEWRNELVPLTESYGFPVHDLTADPDFYCNAFADAGHMGRDCFHPLMRYSMSKYYQNLDRN